MDGNLSRLRTCAPFEHPRVDVKTIAVYSMKGGAGKSAVTVLLAEALACKPFSQRVLVVDLDAQQSTATALLGDEKLHAALEANQSVTALMMARRTGPLTRDATRKFLTVRQASAGRGKFNYLQDIHLLASDREAWHDLDEQMRKDRIAGRNNVPHDTLLWEALAPLNDEFDVALIDFPGHDEGPIVRCGLYAADRWLFPVTPDRMGTRDLDGSRQLIKKVYKGAPRRIKGLGTLLTMCQNRASGEYKSSRHVLRSLAEKRYIPPLFPKEAELCFWTEVKNALDDTRTFNTLDQKLGGSSTTPLYQAVSKLARETVRLLDMVIPVSEAIDADELVNALATTAW
jgi:cellulose biosynthesis protein BcsQ